MMDEKIIVNELLGKIQDCLVQLPEYGLELRVQPVYVDAQRAVVITIVGVDVIRGNLMLTGNED